MIESHEITVYTLFRREDKTHTLSWPIRSANDIPESLGQLDPQMLFQRVYFGPPAHKIATKI